MFDPITDIGAIEGCIADLASRTNRPQGYPFSKIIVYSVVPEIKLFMPKLNHASAIGFGPQDKLDFKKAGKLFPEKVKEWKANISLAPREFVTTTLLCDPVDEATRKTTGCRKYLIEVECQDQEDRWLAIQFRKAIKQYITEDLALNIVPAIFRDTFTSDEEFVTTGKMYKDEKPVVPRVNVVLGNCKERLYHALLQRNSIFDYPYSFDNYATQEFADYPIRIGIPSRMYIADHPEEFTHSVVVDGDAVCFSVSPIEYSDDRI